MILDVVDGPKPSGDEKAAEELNLQDLKAINSITAEASLQRMSLMASTSATNTWCFSTPHPARGPRHPGGVRFRSACYMWARSECSRSECSRSREAAAVGKATSRAGGPRHPISGPTALHSRYPCSRNVSCSAPPCSQVSLPQPPPPRVSPSVEGVVGSRGTLLTFLSHFCSLEYNHV